MDNKFSWDIQINEKIIPKVLHQRLSNAQGITEFINNTTSEIFILVKISDNSLC